MSRAISRHELAVVKVLAEAGDEWVTSNDISARAGVAPRTARAHALNLVNLGIVDRAEVFPANRYRLAPGASACDYFAQLIAAAEVLGIKLPAPSGSNN